LIKEIRFTFTAVKIALPLVFAVLSSFFLIQGNLSLSVEDIAELSTSKIGFNLNVAQNLCRQQANTKVGFLLVFGCWLLQFYNIISQKGLNFRYDKKGIVIAALIGIICFIVAINLSDSYYEELYEKTKLKLQVTINN